MKVRLEQFVDKNHGFIIHAFFLAFVFFFRQPLIDLSSASILEDRESLLLAMIVLFCFFGEWVYSTKKMRYLVANNMNEEMIERASGLGFFVSVLRLFLGIFAGFIYAEALGISEQDMSGVLMIALFITFVKECFVWGPLLASEPKIQSYKKTKPLKIEEEMFFWISIATFYIITWDSIFSRISESGIGDPVELVIFFIAGYILVTIFYVLPQIAYVIEIFYTNKTKKERWEWLFSTFFTMTTVLIFLATIELW